MGESQFNAEQKQLAKLKVKKTIHMKTVEDGINTEEPSSPTSQKELDEKSEV